jgi:outer membrane protein TolC
VDELRIEIEIGDLENQLALLNDRDHVLRVMFNNLLDTDDDAPVNLPDMLRQSELPASRLAIRDSILSGNHRLLSLEFHRESLNYRQEAAKKAGNPDFTVGLDYFVIGQGENGLPGNDAIMFPRIGISIPLYRDKYRSMVKEMVYLESAREQEALNRSNILESMLANSLKEYDDALRRISLYRDQSELAARSLEILESEYTTAHINFEELLRMERKLLKYRLELEKARADSQAAISYITYMMGK